MNQEKEYLIKNGELEEVIQEAWVTGNKEGWGMHSDWPEDGLKFAKNAIANKFVSTPPEHEQEPIISFKRSDWDNWKLKIGEGNYQGSVGVDYIIDWIRFLEDREVKPSPPNT